jgi:hypothetical protein
MSALPPSVERTVDGFATLARLEAELSSISDTRTVANPSGGAHLYFLMVESGRGSPFIPTATKFGVRPATLNSTKWLNSKTGRPLTPPYQFLPTHHLRPCAEQVCFSV